MQNFTYRTPTKLVFGKGAIAQLPEALRPLGKRILLTYGGGSIKKTGLYNTVMGLLDGFEVYELSGIEPNPKYTPSVVDGVKLCKEKKIEAILSVGGGSVLDCSKAIAAGALYDGEPWDLIIRKAKAKAALPIVDVMTLAATGSEYDPNGVISRTETNDKLAYKDELVYPVCSILDPTYTYTVSKLQTAAGAADAMNHVLEQYFCGESSLLADGMCEATIKSLMKNVRIALKEPENYEARAELMLASSLACNGILSLGNSKSLWPMHAIEHAISAYFDITHGVGLAILTPRWMKHILSEKTVDRFVSYGVNVLGLAPSEDKFALANEAIQKTSEFFASLGIPMRLSEVGVTANRIGEMARHIAEKEGLDKAYVPLSEADIAAILTACM